MPDPADIYAPPRADLDLEQPYYVSDDLLVVRSPAVLPQRCVKTGSAESVEWLTRKFIDTSIFTISIVRKECWITYGLSTELRAQIGKRLLICRLILWSAIALFLVTCFTGKFFENGIGALGLLVAIIAAAVCPRFIPLKVVKTSGQWFFVKGCSREFLDTIIADQEHAERYPI